MDYQNEIRILREQTTALQWALAATLRDCHSIAQQSRVNETTLAHLESLRKAVQNLNLEQVRSTTHLENLSGEPNSKSEVNSI